MKYLLFFLFFLNFVFSNNIQDDFKKLSPKEKIAFFLKLDDSLKDENLLFFENEFIRLKEIITNKETKKEYLFCMGMIYQLKKNHIKAITVFNELLNKNTYKLNESKELEILLKLQKSYQYLTIFSKATSSNKRIDELINKGVPYPLWEYNYFSRMYFKLKQYDKAIARLKNEIEWLKNNKERDSLIIPSAYNDLGYYYFLNSNKKEALHNFYLSIKLASNGLRKVNRKSYTELFVTVYNNIAFLYIEHNELEKAEAIYEKYLLEFNRGSNTNYQLETDIFYTSLLLKMNKLENIKFLLNRIDINAYREKYLKKELILKLKYDYYKKINNKTNLINIQDSLLILKEENLIKLEEKSRIGNEINFLIEQNERNEIINQNKLNEKENKFFIIIIFGLVALILLILFSVYTNQLKKKKIELLNTSLQQSVHEKDLLLKEIHHRIKNNLQIVDILI